MVSGSVFIAVFENLCSLILKIHAYPHLSKTRVINLL